MRLLEVCKEDPDRLFFTTLVTTSVLCYSINNDSLVKVPRFSHETSISVLAVSTSANYVLSASQCPRQVALVDLKTATATVYFELPAPAAEVVTAAFHPENEDLFLLGFDDGSLSIHSASAIMAGGHAISRTQVGFAPRLHHGEQSDVNQENESQILREKPNLICAAFLGGHKARTVSLGANGKFKIVNFRHGTHLLRTWWTSDAVGTSLSVLTWLTSPLNKVDMPQASSTSKYSTRSKNLIAIGTSDGSVAIHSSIGLLLGQRQIEPNGEPIIDLCWMGKPDSLSTSNRTLLAQLGKCFLEPIESLSRQA